MRLEQLLTEKRSAIIKRWFDVLVETYPDNTSSFLKTQKDRFANPVGHTILQGMEDIFNELLRGVDASRVAPFLDNVIRIRAVQDFTPSQALSFIFSLKNVIREEINRDTGGSFPYEELLEMESRIDALALLSFDIFEKCREKIYEIKSNELRNMTFRLLQRANMVSEGQGQEPDNADSRIDIDNVKPKEVNK